MRFQHLLSIGILCISCGCSEDSETTATGEHDISVINADTLTETEGAILETAPLEKYEIRLNQYLRDSDEAAAKDFADSNGYASCKFTGKEDAIAEEKLLAEVVCSKSDPTLKSPVRSELISFTPMFRGRFSTECTEEPAEMMITVMKNKIEYWESEFTPFTIKFNGRSTVTSDGEIAWYDDDSPDKTSRENASISLTILKSGRMLFVENDDAYLLDPCKI